MSAVWVVRAGDDNVLAPELHQKSAVAIGWHELGDMSALSNRDQFVQAVKTHRPDDPPRRQANWAGQLYRFVREIQRGDYVLTPIKSTRTIRIGKIAGDYKFDRALFGELGNEFPNIRRVEWLKEVSRDDLTQPFRDTLGSPATVFRADTHLPEIERLLMGTETPTYGENGDIASTGLPAIEEALTPFHEEVKARADELIRDLLARIPGYEFQGLVAALLRAMGYVAKSGPRGRDMGVDVLAHRDPFGFSDPRIKAQVKHRAGQARRPELQALSGTLHPGEHGLFVSTGGFTRDAVDWASQSGRAITLVDGERFVELLLDNYERLDASGRALVPLKEVWIPITD